MSASVKVPTATILVAAKKQEKELLDRRSKKKRIEAQNALVEKRAIVKSLREAAKDPKQATIGHRYRFGKQQATVEVPLLADVQKLPSWNWQDDNTLASVQEDIKLLELTSQTDITVSSRSNFMRYL